MELVLRTFKSHPLVCMITFALDQTRMRTYAYSPDLNYTIFPSGESTLLFPKDKCMSQIPFITPSEFSSFFHSREINARGAYNVIKSQMRSEKLTSMDVAVLFVAFRVEGDF